MIKQLLIAGLILLCIVNISIATVSYTYSIDGTGTFSKSWNDIDWSNTHRMLYYYDGDLNSYIYIKAYWDSTDTVSTLVRTIGQWQGEGTYPSTYRWTDTTAPLSLYTATSIQKIHGGIPYADVRLASLAGIMTGTVKIIVSEYPFIDYTISGNLNCISQTDLYIKNSTDTYILLDTNTSSSFYSFDIVNNSSYKLIFSDGHEYEFDCSDNIIYDRDACSYITLNFKDNCGNLLKGIEGYWYTPDELWKQSFYTSSGSYDILFEDQDFLEIWAYSGGGTVHYNITNPQDIAYNILNPTIAWTNNICVKDMDTNNIIEDALVTLEQDCIIDTSLYPVRHKYTDSLGYATFGSCELDDMDVSIVADGYISGSVNILIGHLDAQTLLRTCNISLSPTTIPITNDTGYYTDIYFKNSDGNYAASVYNNTSYIDLYYYNNNSDHSSMVLKFLKGRVEVLSWNIPYNTAGYKRIYNTDFSDTPNLYRGYMFGINELWDVRTSIMIYNYMIPINENLHVDVFFANKKYYGIIDYREDIKIMSYANASSDYLLTISLELYESDILIEYINLTCLNYSNGVIFHEWKPSHSYLEDTNYTVKMIGYDGKYLYADMVFAKDYRKNKLTIIVKDTLNNNLTNSYVYLEGYGQLPTGTNFFNSYEHLEDGTYRYKASKSGYTSYGWDTITLNSGDEIVYYTLTTESGIERTGGGGLQKLEDTKISDFFFPLMFLMFLMMLLGGFIYVCS